MNCIESSLEQDTAMINVVASRKAIKEEASRFHSAAVCEHERTRRSFWRLFRTGVAECGTFLLVSGIMCYYMDRELVSPQVAVPIALACLIVSVWRGALYFAKLSR